MVVPKEEPAPAQAAEPVMVKAPEPAPVVPVVVPLVVPTAAAGPWSRAAMRLQEAKAPALVPNDAEPQPEPPQPPPPGFLSQPPQPSGRWRGILAIGAGLALGAAGFQTRELWLPRLMTTVKSALPASAPPSFGLNTLDSNGQLQIRWDRSSLPVRTGVAAILEIIDGAEGRPQNIPMDPQHIQTGVFTYGRRGDKVEVRLTIRMPDGRDIRQVTTFLGALPLGLPAPEDPEVRRQRDELAKEAAKLKADLAAQEKRTRKLERSLTDVQNTLKEEQLKRLENQVPPK
jgi:hypothetical protein